MKINQTLLCGAPNQFLLSCYQHLYENHSVSALGWPRQTTIEFLWTFLWKSVRFCSAGCPRQITFDFLCTFKWKYIRFCFRLPQTFFVVEFLLTFIWKSMRFCSGFDQFPMIFKQKLLNINQILLWASPDQFPLIFYQNINENQSDSTLWCPRPIPVAFL